MTNRINGDFDTESIEAFRAAYAAQMQTPQDQEVDEYTRLPTNVVSNTSPWIQHTGLWKANPGNSTQFVPNQVLSEPEEELETEELSEEEIESLIDEILSEDNEEDLEDLEEAVESMLSALSEGYDEDDPEDFEDLIEQILSEIDEDAESYPEEQVTENIFTDSELDELIDSLYEEIEEATLTDEEP